MKKIAITLLTFAFIYFSINVSVQGIEPQTDFFIALDCESLGSLLKNEPQYTDWSINHYNYRVHNPTHKTKVLRLFLSYEHEPADSRYFITVGFLGFSKSRCFGAGGYTNQLNLDVSNYITKKLTKQSLALKKQYGIAK